jgi:hypothetical protein
VNVPINYRLLGLAQSHYSQLGFDYIEVPWIVEVDTIKQTLPDPEIRIHRLYPMERDWIKYPALVGSAEQSFIQVAKDDRWFAGTYQSITPCFRDDEVDNLHNEYFMKLELFTNTFPLEYLIEAAKTFFSTYVDCKVVQTEQGFDIIDSKFGIELGSYYNRTIKGIGCYSCGTGIAEPRLSTVIEMIKFMGVN